MCSSRISGWFAESEEQSGKWAGGRVSLTHTHFGADPQKVKSIIAPSTEGHLVLASLRDRILDYMNQGSDLVWQFLGLAKDGGNLARYCYIFSGGQRGAQAPDSPCRTVNNGVALGRTDPALTVLLFQAMTL